MRRGARLLSILLVVPLAACKSDSKSDDKAGADAKSDAKSEADDAADPASEGPLPCLGAWRSTEASEVVGSLHMFVTKERVVANMGGRGLDGIVRASADPRAKVEIRPVVEEKGDVFVGLEPEGESCTMVMSVDGEEVKLPLVQDSSREVIWLDVPEQLPATDDLRKCSRNAEALCSDIEGEEFLLGGCRTIVAIDCVEARKGNPDEIIAMRAGELAQYRALIELTQPLAAEKPERKPLFLRAIEAANGPFAVLADFETMDRDESDQKFYDAFTKLDDLKVIAKAILEHAKAVGYEIPEKRRPTIERIAAG